MKEYEGQDVATMSVEDIQTIMTKIHQAGLFGGIIYCYTNPVNGKSYVGQTVNPIARHKAHIKHSKDIESKEYNLPLHAAIRKHGISKFDYKVKELIIAPEGSKLKVLMNAYEIVWIDIMHSDAESGGYNATIGGNIVGVGKLHPNSKQVDEYDLATRKFIKTYSSLFEAGNAHGVSDGVIRNLVQHKVFSRKGSVFCFHGEQPIFEDPKPKKRLIHQYTLQGQWIRAFDSLQEASESTGLSNTSISVALNAERNPHRSGKFLWYKCRRTSCPSWEGLKDQYFLYDESGNFVFSCSMKKEVCDFLGIKGTQQVTDAVLDPAKKVRGYYIRTVKANNLKEIQDYTPELPTKERQVSCYDPTTGKAIQTYLSIANAYRANGAATSSQLHKAIRTGYTTFNNMYWRFGNAPQIDVSNIGQADELFYAVDSRTNQKIASFSSIAQACQRLSQSARNISFKLRGLKVKSPELEHLEFHYYDKSK